MKAKDASATLVSPPKRIFDFRAETEINTKSPYSTVNRQSKIGNFNAGLWQKGVCTWLSTGTMSVRVRPIPPFFNFAEEKYVFEFKRPGGEAMKI